MLPGLENINIRFAIISMNGKNFYERNVLEFNFIAQN